MFMIDYADANSYISFCLILRTGMKQYLGKVIGIMDDEIDRHTCFFFIFMKFHKHEAFCFYYLCTKTVEKIIDFLC